MNVSFSQEQELLRSSAREVLARECPMSVVRERLDGPADRPDALWKTLAGLGWPGLSLPTQHGGAGLGPIELAVLLEEMGRVLLPGPFLSSVVGSSTIALGGSEAQRARWLPALARGELRATLAPLEDAGADAEGIHLRADAGGFVCSGTKLFVPDALGADLLVVPVPEGLEGALTLLVVAARSPGVAIRPIAFTDATRRLAELSLREVCVPADAVLGEPRRGAPVLAAILDRAKLALCAELCGGAARVLELCVDYAKTREQFGRPIGSFQAIQHRLADLYVLVESARSATYFAAWALAAGDPGAHAAACMAKAFCSDACVRVAGEGIQIHGGLGFTWEQDLHLYYKRAKASALAFGDAATNREEVARCLLDARAGV